MLTPPLRDLVIYPTHTHTHIYPNKFQTNCSSLQHELLVYPFSE